MEHDLSLKALQYAAAHLLYVAGFSKKDITFDGLTAVAAGTLIRFLAPKEGASAAILSGAEPVVFVHSADEQIEIPLFGGTELYHWESETLVFDADVLTISFLLLTAYEDTVVGIRNQDGQFLYQNSIAAKYQLIDFPLVDEYAMLLRKAMQENGVQLAVRCPQIIPTHDVDTLWRFRNPVIAAKSILGGDLLLRKSPSIALNSMKDVLYSRCKPERDPLNQACIRLCELSAENGLTSEFYFLGYGRDEADWRYDVQHPSVCQLMAELERRHAVVGIHGGLESFQQGSVYAVQKQRVDAAYGKATVSGRQHYLLFSAAETPAILEKNGLKTDSSLGFFDREGFRCGTCYPYPLYDLKKDQSLSLIERPLILMDVTVQFERKLTIPEAFASAKKLLDRVVAVGGDFVILWHNSSLDRGMEPWFQQFYIPFIKDGAAAVKAAEKC